jgi:hypothetical protein
MAALLRSSGMSTMIHITDLLRLPLYRNPYALVLSSAATSGLGSIY